MIIITRKNEKDKFEIGFKLSIEIHGCQWLLYVFLGFHVKVIDRLLSHNCRPPTYHASGFFVACLIVKATAPTQPVPMMTNRGAS